MQVSSFGGGGGAANVSLPQQAQQMRQRLFAQADQDGSGSLSVQEFLTATKAGAGSAANTAQQLFKALDSNGDNNVSRAELDRAMGRPTQDGFGSHFADMATDSLGALLGAQEKGKDETSRSGNLMDQMLRQMLQAYGAVTGAEVSTSR